MKTLLNASILVFALLLVGCSGGSDGGGGQPGAGAGDDTTAGDSTSNSPGSNTGGTNNNTGGSDSGTSTDGSGNTDGGTNNGGSTNGGGDSGGGADPGTAFATLANLYTAENIRLNFNNCNVLANGSVNFSQAVFRLIAQSGDQVSAVLSLTPDSQFIAQFDQTVINLTGTFTGENSVAGSFSALSTLNGVVVDRAQSTFTFSLVLGTTLLINLDPDSDPQACHISGGFDLNETTDPGTGGDTGGGSGGGDTGGGGDSGSGTGSGGTGGNTGGGSTGGLIIATGQFGSLQMLSQEFPEDNGTFEMTTVQFVNIPGNEMFAWTNAQQVTANFYFGLDNDNTTLNSVNSRAYSCNCFPAVDLINNQVVFSNLVLTKNTIPTGSITLNGTLTFPPTNP
ncbi:hypothetical protein [Kaarinaea lacus]